MKIPMIIVLAILISLAAMTLTNAIMAYGVRKDRLFFRVFTLQALVGVLTIVLIFYARATGS